MYILHNDQKHNIHSFHEPYPSGTVDTIKHGLKHLKTLL